MQYFRHCQTESTTAFDECVKLLATILLPRATSGNNFAAVCYAIEHDNAATTSTNTAETPFSPPSTDVCMDRGDACSLGCLLDLNRHFLLIIDKDTEYFVSFLIKTCASPFAPFEQVVTCTGRNIRYLPKDGAKGCQSEEIVDYCAKNDVVLQLVVAYNHTMQASIKRPHVQAWLSWSERGTVNP